MANLKLTTDERLHDKTPEFVFFMHHGIDPSTGESRPGVVKADEGCECAHCQVHLGNADAESLNALKAKFAADKAKQKKAA